MGIYLGLILLLMKLGKSLSDDNSCYLKVGDIIEEPLDDLAVFILDVGQNNLIEWN
jgi:hypothetical protein